MHLALVPHPAVPSLPAMTLDAEVRRDGDRLSLEFAVGGPVEMVRQPEPAPRVQTDELWRTTCFEAFVQIEGGYVEYNLSPSGAWAAYQFDGYREGMRRLDMLAPFIVTRSAPGQFVLTADVSLPPDATGPISLTAVIESLDSQISYWALAHASDKPDFHHPDSFVLELP